MQGVGEIRSREMAVYDFHRGTDTHAYETLGVHRGEAGRSAYVFRLFAPRARAVALCADFLEDGTTAMHSADEAGMWEVEVSAGIPLEGMRYTYRLETSAGTAEIADPYARRGLWGGEVGSLICTETSHLWGDSLWMWRRARLCRGKREGGYAHPLNLYEVHLGSFFTQQGRSNAAGDAFLNYRELGEHLARYLSDMGYTHVKLMPLTEHPWDDSHGYLPSGYFAPTSRYGSPDDLREMVDRLHRAGVGVVMDLPLGAYADGAGEARTVDPTCPEVRSLLLSAALFWLREFHLDGLCFSGMQAWSGDERESRELLHLLCAAVEGEFPDVLLIAGEEVGEAVGFDLLCRHRFAGDVMGYLHADPMRRRYLRDRLTLSMRNTVGDGGRAMLPLSCEAVSAGHGSLFCAMYGGYLQKFEGVRLCLAYQMVHPGKKWLFMGCELGQLRTWDDTLPRDWFLTELEPHGRLQRYVRALNHLYREDARLWQADHLWNGFCEAEVLAAESEGDVPPCVLALKRFDASGRELLAVLCFTAEETTACRCAVGGRYARYREVFNSDSTAFGGAGRVGAGQEIPVGGDGTLSLTLPPMTAVFYEPVPMPGRVEQMTFLLDGRE